MTEESIEGRWTIFVCTGCGGATGRHRACDALREATPVVPVDDAAVERGADALVKIAARWGLGEWQHSGAAEMVREVLRAAGEQP